MKQNRFEDNPILDPTEGVPLFRPHIPKNSKLEISHTLDTRWIGQGPKVDKFENQFSKKFLSGDPGISVNSGTSALHLSYLLAGLKSTDEVLVPLFTCTATNIPLLYLNCKIRFVDVDPATLNISIEDLGKKISAKTKAIVVVHYGGFPVDLEAVRKIADELKIPVISDNAHAVGTKVNGIDIHEFCDYSMYSFQAIKHITTGDGGMIGLSSKHIENVEEKKSLAKKLRWFGIDREAKQGGIWENDITDIGFKYQMTDLSASLGIAAMEEIDETINLRRNLLNRYEENLIENDDLQIIGKSNGKVTHGAWLFTIKSKKRKKIQEKLRNQKIESGQVHFRNDIYSIFANHLIKNEKFPNMDLIEDDYLVLPLHTHISLSDVDRICEIINSV
jgi:perosamine synthetase